MSVHSRSILAAAFLAAGVAVGLTGCGHTPTHPSAPHGSSSGDVPSVVVDGIDTSDPDAVISGALARVYSWHPATDTDSADAFDRADDLLDPAYIAEVGPTASGLATVTAAEWARWADEHASLAATATVTPDDHPADTATIHQRVVAITQHVTGTSAPEPDRTVVAYVTATRDPNGWRVALIAPR